MVLCITCNQDVKFCMCEHKKNVLFKCKDEEIVNINENNDLLQQKVEESFKDLKTRIRKRKSNKSIKNLETKELKNLEVK